MPSPLATVAIASIGEMGAGIATLLNAHDYRVLTNVADRSESTRHRARGASVEIVQSDQSLVEQSDYILSIVPPKDAVGTAEKILHALKGVERKTTEGLYYVDLNAISPNTAKRISKMFEGTGVVFVDGGIIGPPPTLNPSTSTWSRPSLVLSGPHTLPARLAETLNVKHVSSTIGPASGLKMCFASMTKGLTAIGVQAITTARKMGVLEELQEHLGSYSPKTGDLVRKGVVGMPPKAYRWIDEMKEIAATMEEGGFERGLFEGVSEVYRIVAEDTELGREKTGQRKSSATVEDVARCIGEAMDEKKEKVE